MPTAPVTGLLPPPASTPWHLHAFLCKCPLEGIISCTSKFRKHSGQGKALLTATEADRARGAVREIKSIKCRLCPDTKLGRLQLQLQVQDSNSRFATTMLFYYLLDLAEADAFAVRHHPICFGLEFLVVFHYCSRVYIYPDRPDYVFFPPRPR